MAWEAVVLAQLAPAAFLVALAAALLWLDPYRRVNRAFALVLVARALLTGVNRADDVAAPAQEALWEALRVHLLLALVAALLNFLLAYARTLRPRTRRLARAGVLAAFVGAEAAYLLDHCSVVCRGVDGLLHMGPLGPLHFAGTLAYGVVAYALARDAARDPDSRRRLGGALVAAAFVVAALFESAITLAVWARVGFDAAFAAFAASPWTTLGFAARALGAVPAVAGLAVLRAAAPSSRAVILAAAAAASGVLVGVAPASLDGAMAVLTGLWGLAMPALVAYALLKHRLFDLDLRLRWTLHRGTVATAFFAAFLVVSEVAENFLDEKLGLLAGGAAAGLLLFALHPIQRASERLAHAALPRAKRVDEMRRDERLELYRAQVSLAWADGALDRSERLLLEQLRVRLDLTLEEAAPLEREAALAAPAGGGA